MRYINRCNSIEKNGKRKNRINDWNKIQIEWIQKDNNRYCGDRLCDKAILNQNNKIMMKSNDIKNELKYQSI